MKKRLLFLVALFVTTMAFAYDAQIGGIYYYLNSEKKTATVTHNGDLWGGGGYDNITTITIPSKVVYGGEEYIVTSIWDQTFYRNKTLSSVVISENIKEINYQAFAGCSSLTSVSLPNTLTFIGYGAFSGCKSLESITLPNSVTTIFDAAFGNCSSLKTITIPNSVTTLGSEINSFRNVFVGCSSLLSVNVEESNQYLTSVDGVLYNKDKTKLIICPGAKTSFSIPNTVVIIGKYAFQGCNFLSAIVIPESVTEIEDAAFYYCSSLESVTFNNDNIKIGNDAFYGTPWFENQPDGCIYVGNCLYTYKGEMAEGTHIDIKEGITFICTAALGDQPLASVTIPNTVIEIGNGAFNETLITSIEIPNSVIKLGDGVFSGCKNLTKVTIGSGTLEIGVPYDKFLEEETVVGVGEIFLGCSSLKEFIIDENNPNYKTIDNVVYSKDLSILYFCSPAKTSINSIPENLKKIETLAFYGTSLSSFIVPNSVVELGYMTFGDSQTLKTVTLGNNITFINCYTFVETDLDTIVSLSINPPKVLNFWAEEETQEALYSINTETCVLIVPEVAKDAYANHPIWGEFMNIETIKEEKYSVTASSAAPEMGGVKVILVAEPIEGFEFVRWSDDNTDNPRTIELTKDIELQAYFKIAEGSTVNLETSKIISAEVYGNNGVLYVDGAEVDYHVLDAAGRLIYSGRDAALSLPRGVYVVVVGDEVEKVVL